MDKGEAVRQVTKLPRSLQALELAAASYQWT